MEVVMYKPYYVIWNENGDGLAEIRRNSKCTQIVVVADSKCPRTPHTVTNLLTNAAENFYIPLMRQLQLLFDCNSTALRPFDDLRYDRRPTCV